MPPATSGFQSCELGQQSLYQPPVSITTRLPSASSNTSVGWKSLLSETRKSSSFDVKVEPLGVKTCRVTFCMLKRQAKRLSRYSGPKLSDSYRVSPHGAAGPKCESTGIRSGLVCGCSSRTSLTLP